MAEYVARMRVRELVVGMILVISSAVAIQWYARRKTAPPPPRGQVICENTWKGYKARYLEHPGRLKRPVQDDTVARGQAGVMLRAVWMRDKETFDNCYRWAENHLSRKVHSGDNLLAGRWKDGMVRSWKPDTGANLDYALSLLFAAACWGSRHPEGMTDYRIKAERVTADILEILTFRTSTGRLYLSPVIVASPGKQEKFVLNPSQYAPAHFRYFLEQTGDERWDELLETGYMVLEELLYALGDQRGMGLFPDFCSVDRLDRLAPPEELSSDFGTEAVLIPLRVSMDFYWYGSEDARRLLASDLSLFIEKQWNESGALYAGYGYAGEVLVKEEDPLFYAAYYCVLAVSSSDLAEDILRTMRRALIKERGRDWYFSREWYSDSLAWFAEGFSEGIISIPG
ncbi:MAG: glycosyl hydrolase family 8 [Candidatus Omnitrophica bacterium]|nr:glycosyl hydrolase family 8 [Candidatus Omnitrophota bacterium]